MLVQLNFLKFGAVGILVQSKFFLFSSFSFFCANSIQNKICTIRILDIMLNNRNLPQLLRDMNFPQQICLLWA